jgi:molecular chaperone DnaK (HSP70)
VTVKPEVILGIDFGTSYTSAGALLGDRVDLVPDGGDTAIPTVVYVPPTGPLEVGRRALMRVLQDPQDVVRSVKRVLGVAPASPLIKQYMHGAPFRIGTVNDRLVFKLRSGDLAPEQVAAAVLTRVRELAEQRFGGTVRKAVITTAAAPPTGYREAVTRAAKLAHLDVLELIPEPIAGALSLGLHGEVTNRRLLICDFGGGTFDVAALVQEGLRFHVVAAYGDSFLGGDDLDEALAEGVAGAIVRRTRYDMHADSVRWSELLFRCEAVKRQLSARAEAALAMRDAYREAGQSKDLDVRIERAWAEAVWAPLFQRAAATIGETLRRAGWAVDDVDAIAMIGGGAAVPSLQRAVAELFPDKAMRVPARADLAVAEGAVLLTTRFGATPRMVPVLDRAAS